MPIEAGNSTTQPGWPEMNLERVLNCCYYPSLLSPPVLYSCLLLSSIPPITYLSYLSKLHLFNLFCWSQLTFTNPVLPFPRCQGQTSNNQGFNIFSNFDCSPAQSLPLASSSTQGSDYCGRDASSAAAQASAAPLLTKLEEE